SSSASTTTGHPTRTGGGGWRAPPWQEPDRLLAAPVSNQYLDIGSVVERMGLEFAKQAVVVESQGDNEGRSLPAICILLTSSGGLLENPRLKALAGGTTSKPGADVWTDDYSNLFCV